MVTVTVSSTAGLVTAVKAAQDGETIRLAPGQYDGVNLRGLTFAKGITITSADPAHEANLTNFTLHNMQGVNFSNLEMTATGGPTAGFAFQIQSSSNITFDHVYAHGSLNGNSADDAGGILLQNTNNIKVANSEFTQLGQAVGVMGADHVAITNNYAHALMKTGFVLSGASDVQISHNTISGIVAVDGQHPDAIQFFTTGTTTAAHDINISDNVILRGTGDFTQGIFLRDQTGKLPYQNVTIANNLVDGTGYGGIYVQGANGLNVSGNDLVSVPGKINATWVRVENGQNVTFTNNQAVGITFDANTHPTETGDTLNTVVHDGGAAAIDAWAISHPGAGSSLLSLTTASSVAASTASTIEALAPYMVNGAGDTAISDATSILAAHSAAAPAPSAAAVPELPMQVMPMTMTVMDIFQFG